MSNEAEAEDEHTQEQEGECFKCVELFLRIV